jgi:hypothetical protein
LEETYNVIYKIEGKVAGEGVWEGIRKEKRLYSQWGWTRAALHAYCRLDKNLKLQEEEIEEFEC